MNNKQLKVYFYYKSNNTSPIYNYYSKLDIKVRRKILAYIDLLIHNNGSLGMPYTKYMGDKVWELRVDFNKIFHRIFYFVFDGEKIILLHGFNKKTNKTPIKEINQALKNQKDYIFNLNNYMKDKKTCTQPRLGIKLLSFDEVLKKELKNPEFRKGFELEKKKLQLSLDIIKLRKKQKLSQAKLAQKLGMKQSSIGRIESGEQNLTLATLQNIASVFNKELVIGFK